MKFIKHAICLAIIAMAFFAVPIQAKKVKKDIYIFGCSASFTDSIIYITDVQVLKDAEIDSKTMALAHRDMYSTQLKEYLSEKKGQPHRTCFVIFSDKAKKITKKLVKVKNLYTVKSRGKFNVQYLTLDDFLFTIIHDEEEETVENNG